VYPRAGACRRPRPPVFPATFSAMNAASSASPDEHFRVLDLFSPNDAHADPRHQAPAAESATGPAVGGSPESLVFVNPLFAAVRDARDARR
jgi:hypothetical protein